LSRARHCSQQRAEGWAVIRASAQIRSTSNPSCSPTRQRTPTRGGDTFKRVRLLRC
ncbi:hypothetical protein L208DRAFT_1393612, partial [Tricholoma matsutake]